MASLIKRGNSWYLDWYENGLRKKKSLGVMTEREAKLNLEYKKAELSPLYSKLNKEAELKQIDYFSYSKKYLNWFEKKYPTTYSLDLSVSINNLEPHFNKTLLHKIDNDMVEDLIDSLTDYGNATSTINRKLGILKAILNKAKKDKYKTPDLLIDNLQVYESKPHAFFNQEELNLLYENSPSHWHWFMLMANTGLRLSELFNLKVDDVDRVNDHLYIISTNKRRTKSKKWRLIPINANARKALNHFDLSSKYVFPQTINKKYPTTALTRACKKVGIKKGKWGVHTLRHTFGSHMAMSNKSMRTIQIIMGHASIKTTEIYAHLSPDYLKGSTDDVNL
jgi:integrase